MGIEAVQAQIDKRRREIVSISRVGPPCYMCVHYRPLKRCNHPALSPLRYDHVSGDLIPQPPVTAEDARKGACGPEALLFEPFPFPVQVALAFHKTAWAEPVYYLGGGALVVAILGALGLQ